MRETIETWLQTPVTPADALPIVVMGGLLLVAIAGGLGALGKVRRAQPDDDAVQRASALRRWRQSLPVTPLEAFGIYVIGLVFAVLFLLALVAAFLAVVDVITGVVSQRPGGVSFGIGALLVALLGAPFLIWRTVVAQRTLEATQRQTVLQEEAQFNDKINAAATDLAARRQVTRIVGYGAQKRILTEWQDDLVTRAAAIDRLEGLAQEAIERDDYPPAQRIARMLSIYVQELSREYPASEAPEFE
jgi:hypothetical protein